MLNRRTARSRKVSAGGPEVSSTRPGQTVFRYRLSQNPCPNCHHTYIYWPFVIFELNILQKKCTLPAGCSFTIVFFSKKFSKVCHLSFASTRLLLVVQKIMLIGVTVYSHSVESFEGLLQQCRRGRGCCKLGTKKL